MVVVHKVRHNIARLHQRSRGKFGFIHRVFMFASSTESHRSYSKEYLDKYIFQCNMFQSALRNSCSPMQHDSGMDVWNERYGILQNIL